MNSNNYKAHVIVDSLHCNTFKVLSKKNAYFCKHSEKP